MLKRPVCASLVVVAVLAAGAACSDSSSESPEQKASKSASAAAKTVCQNLDKLKQDTDHLRNLDPATTSKNDLQAAVDTVKQDLDNVSASSGELGNATGAAVKAASESVKSAIQGIDSNSTVQTTVNALKLPLQGLSGTLSTANSALHCTPSS